MLRKSKFFLIVTTLSLLSILGASVVFAAPAPKVDVCHLDDTGAYIKINVSENAFPAHEDHGDAPPGEPAPGMPGKEFADDCTLVDVNANVEGTWWGQSGIRNTMGFEFFMYLNQDSAGNVTGTVDYYDYGAVRTVTGSVIGDEFTFRTHDDPNNPDAYYWADCTSCTVTLDGTYFHGYGTSISEQDIEWEATKQ